MVAGDNIDCTLGVIIEGYLNATFQHRAWSLVPVHVKTNHNLGVINSLYD